MEFACGGESRPATVTLESSGTGGLFLGGLRGLGRGLQSFPRSVFALITVLWFAWIAHLSSGPIELDTPLPFGSFLTNLAHAPLFGLAALWICGALARRGTPFPWPRISPGSALFVVGVVALYGMTDEWHQSTVPERSACWLDVLTDTTAAACVVWTVRAVGEAQVSEGRTRLVLLACVLACCSAAAAATAFCA